MLYRLAELDPPLDRRPVELQHNCPLGHEGPFHGLNPQESARNHGYETPGALREAAASRVLEFTYKYL